MVIYQEARRQRYRPDRYLPALLMAILGAGLLASKTASQGLNNVFIVSLYGANEVALPGDPTATGTARLDFSTQTGSLFFVISLQGTTEPTAVNLLYGDANSVSGTGAVGSNGAILSLMQLTTTVTSSSYGSYELSGAVPVPLDLITAIVQVPQLYYIQVYSRDYPYGACRGQLASPTTSASVTVSNADTQVWTGSVAGTASATSASTALGADHLISGSSTSSSASLASAASAIPSLPTNPSLMAMTVVPTSTVAAASVVDFSVPSTVRMSDSNGGVPLSETEIGARGTEGQSSSNSGNARADPSTVGIPQLANLLQGTGTEPSQRIEVLGELNP